MTSAKSFRRRSDHGCVTAELAAKVRHDLDALDYPNIDWLPAFESASGPVYDVVIVGAGQGGLAVGFALFRERVRNILLLDGAARGREGPWVTFARMRTLRTPKYLSGPELGLPDLGFRAWYAATYEWPDWAELERIPRSMWMDYLNWFRATVDLPVRNEVRVERVEPDQSGLLSIHCTSSQGGEMLLTRKLVMANGLEGSGEWYLPDDLTATLPRERYAHTAEHIEFDALRGQSVGVLGFGASAIDNAAEALDRGVAQVDVFARRPELPTGERRQWLENNGFLRHFAELDDALRWRAIRHICEAGTPAPPWSMDRISQHQNCEIHAGEPWLSTRMEDERVVVETSAGTHRFDFLVFGTGIVVDLSLRPELAAFAGQIATWADRYKPPRGEECPPLETYPYLGAGFELTELVPGAAPALRNIHIFNWGATPSMGISASSITGMKFGVPRLVAGITRDFYHAYAARHVDAFPRWRPEIVKLD